VLDGLAVAVPVILWTSVGPASALGRGAAIALAVIWRRGVGLQALCPQLGMLGVANLALCLFAALRPPRVSLWVLGLMVALSPWVADAVRWGG
jgi:hypothetical protein